MKKTIDIYTVMQTSKKDRDLCYNFTSFNLKSLAVSEKSCIFAAEN